MFNREPALWMGLIGALVSLGTSFGLHLSAEQVGAISAAAAAILSVITRSQVSPVSKP